MQAITDRAKPVGKSDRGAERIAAMFAVAETRKDALEQSLGLMLTPHRLIVLLLLRDGPMCARELADAVRALDGTRGYGSFSRLRHRSAAFMHLRALAKRKLVFRKRCDQHVSFHLRQRVRRKLDAHLDLSGGARVLRRL